MKNWAKFSNWKIKFDNNNGFLSAICILLHQTLSQSQPPSHPPLISPRWLPLWLGVHLLMLNYIKYIKCNDFVGHISKKYIVFRIYSSDKHYIQILFLSSAQNFLTSECSPVNILLKNDIFYKFPSIPVHVSANCECWQ